MAEGYLRHVASDRFEVHSAGIEPKGLNPLAVEAMREINVDISAQRSKDVREFLAAPFQFVITVCSNAREKCPVFPATLKSLHWDIADPAAATGSHQEKLAAFRRARDEITAHIKQLTAEAIGSAGGNK
jgi:arsenate reductase (thioredoxin)